MKSKTTLFLLSSLIITVGYLPSVTAVTDAELEVLEKQIEQLEAKEKKAEAEAKRKAKAEAKRMAEAEAEKQAKEKRKQEAEDKRLAEEEMKRQEKEVKKREEEEMKEKYTLLITEAEQAINNKDKVLAISKYEKALALYPDDVVATLGIKNAESLKHKLCYEVLGAWIWDNKYTLNIRENGTFTGTGIGERTWNCSDPENRTIELDIPLATMIATLSTDGKCLKASNLFSEGCYVRP